MAESTPNPELGPEDPDAVAEALLAHFSEQIGQESPLGGLTMLAAEFWRGLVKADVPPYFAAVLTAQWLSSNGTMGQTADD